MAQSPSRGNSRGGGGYSTQHQHHGENGSPGRGNYAQHQGAYPTTAAHYMQSQQGPTPKVSNSKNEQRSGNMEDTIRKTMEGSQDGRNPHGPPSFHHNPNLNHNSYGPYGGYGGHLPYYPSAHLQQGGFAPQPPGFGGPTGFNAGPPYHMSHQGHMSSDDMNAPKRKVPRNSSDSPNPVTSKVSPTNKPKKNVVKRTPSTKSSPPKDEVSPDTKITKTSSFEKKKDQSSSPVITSKITDATEEDILSSNVDPMRSSYHFYALELKETHINASRDLVLRQMEKVSDVSTYNSENIDPYLVTTALNERLMRCWENESSITRNIYLSKEEEDRQRFMTEDEIAGRHCATLTARAKSPKAPGNRSSENSTHDAVLKDDDDKVISDGEKEQREEGGKLNTYKSSSSSKLDFDEGSSNNVVLDNENGIIFEKSKDSNLHSSNLDHVKNECDKDICDKKIVQVK